jgi:hypothetical protein
VLVPTGNTANDTRDSFHEELGRVFDQFPNFHTKMLLGYFSSKKGREDISKSEIGNDSLHDDSNVNVVIVNVATSRNLSIVQYLNITKFTSTPGVFVVERHSQNDHTLIDRRQHSNVLDVRSFRAAD